MDADLCSVHQGKGFESLAAEGVAAIASARLDSALQRLLQSEPLSIDGFRALLDYVEAVLSYVHNPPAAKESWFWGLGQMVVQGMWELFNACTETGLDVSLVSLSESPVAEARKRTRAENDLAVEVGTPGKVLWVVRPAARIGTEQVPGRIVYGVAPAGTKPIRNAGGRTG